MVTGFRAILVRVHEKRTSQMVQKRTSPPEWYMDQI